MPVAMATESPSESSRNPSPVAAHFRPGHASPLHQHELAAAAESVHVFVVEESDLAVGVGSTGFRSSSLDSMRILLPQCG